MLPACVRPPGSPFPMATSLRWPPVLDSSGRPYRPGRAGAGPRDCGGLSRAAGPGLLPLHGAETVSPGDELTAAAAVGSPSGARMALGAPLPGLTLVLSDRRSGLVIAWPLQPSQLVVAGFGGGGRSYPGFDEKTPVLTGGLLHHPARLLSFLATLAARHLLTVIMGD